MTLVLPQHVQNVGVDLAIELEQLSFAVTTKLARAGGTDADEGGGRGAGNGHAGAV